MQISVEARRTPGRGVEVVLEPVVRDRLDEEQRPSARVVRGWAGGAGGVAHVVETVEHGHQVVGAGREVSLAPATSNGPGRRACLCGAPSRRAIDASW